MKVLNISSTGECLMDKVKVDKLTEENQILHAEIDRLKADKKDKEKLINQLNGQIEQFKGQATGFPTQLSELLKVLKTSQNVITQLRAENKQWQAQKYEFVD
jgi:chromosome segregation ATPase